VDFSLFGNLELFSEIVRSVVPFWIGVPSYLRRDDANGLGQISFEYYSRGELTWLTFVASAAGAGLVSVSNGVSEFMRFQTLDELRHTFPVWYAGLAGGD
jgi:hypothetical protein